MKNIGLIILFLFLLIVGCTSVSEDDLIDDIDLSSVTYMGNVKTIIDNNCVVCHNSGLNPIGPFPLETFEQVKDKAENGTLLFRIQLPDGDPNIMPQTGKMPQSTIDVILEWKEQGFLLE